MLHLNLSPKSGIFGGKFLCLSKIISASFLILLFQVTFLPDITAQCQCPFSEGGCTTNPDFSATCEELKVVLVLDESASILFGSGHETDVEDAATAFVNALNGTGAQIAIVEFATTASTVFDYSLVDDAFSSDVNDYLTCDDLGNPCDFGSYAPNENNWTNWEAALNEVVAIDAVENADLVVFVTDGNPTAFDVNTVCGNTGSCWNSCTDEACPAANLLKAGDTHMFALGVGESINTNNLISMSDNLLYDGTNFAQADYFITDNFDDLAQDIKAIAVEVCGTDLAVSKTVDPCFEVVNGQNVVDFTVEVTNLGTPNGLSASNVLVTDDIESGYNYLAATSDVGDIDFSSGTVTWDNFDLAVGETRTLTITVEVNSTGNFTNVAFVNADNALSVEDAAVSSPTFDDIPPVILDVPDFDIGECNGDWPTELMTTWTDNESAGGDLTSDGGGTVTLNPDGCSQSRTYTFMVADDCGNEATETTIVTRDFDEDAPIITEIDDFELQGCNTPWPDVTFNWTDACGVMNETSGTALAVPGDVTLNDCTESRIYNVTVVDDCDNESSTLVIVSRFVDDEDPVVTCPPNVIDLGCHATRPSVQDAINEITASDNCGIQSIEATPGDILGDCVLTQTFNVVVTDDCDKSSNCDVIYTWIESDPLEVTCPENDVILPACSTQSEIETAFASWIAGFSVSGGCNTTSNIDDLPTLPAFDCGNALNLSFMLSATSDCSDETCSSSFSVEEEDDLVIDCPNDVNLSACSTKSEIEAAYDNWVAGFTIEGGCNTISNIADIPTLPAFDCGNVVSLNFTLNVSDDCGEDSCSASFNVEAEEDLEVNCPQNVNLPACSTQSEIEAAYALWAAGFTVQGGCNTTSNLDDLPALPAFNCGNEVSFSFTLNASDDCGDDSCSASFHVAAEDDLVVNCPSPVTLGSSLTEQEIINAYNLWVAGFSVEGGCNASSNIDQIPSLPSYGCGNEIDLSFTLTASDDCGSTDCESTFFVPGVQGLTVSCPTDPILPACSTAAEIQAAYDIWVAGFSVNNGDNPTSNIADIPALTAFDCGNAVNLSFTLSASDACTQDASCTATFTVLAEEDLAVSCPQNVNLPACSTQSEIEAAYALWAAGFTVQGGCNTTSNLDDLPALPAFDCGNEVSFSFTLNASDDCGDDSCSASFNVAAEDDLVLNCPSPVTLGSSITEQEIITAYNLWVAGFSVEGGCNASSNIDQIPSLPSYGCGNEIDLSFTLTASDDCGSTDCESTFFVPGVQGLTVSCPTDPILPACSTAAEIQAAYDIWVAGFSVNNGDNPTSNIADIPALTAFDCGNAVNLSFTLSASDACTQDASCTATFTVLAEEDLSVSCPQNVNLPACSTQSEIEAAYALWAAGFTVQGGCNTTSNLDDLPALPAFDCGNEVSFSFTLNASDDCGDDSCSASFNVAAEDDLVVNCPSPVTLGSSLTEQEIITAYNLWVAGFTVEGGCNTTSNIDQIPSLPSYDCGNEIDLSFTLTASDDCGSTDCESTFFVPGVQGLTVSCPTDPILPACSTAAEIQAAYDIWVAGFSVNNGDNPTSNIADIPALTAFDCGNAVNLSFTLSASDACTQDASCTATFTVLAEEDLAVSCPQNVNLPACSTQSEIEAAYALWAAGFTVQGGCNTTSNLDDLPALPAFDCGNEVSFSFTLNASDDCGDDSCSASFNVAAEDDLVVNCPSPVTLGSSITEQEIITAYNLWVAGFSVEGGCNASSNIDQIPSLPSYDCGSEIDLSFTLTASDDCGSTDCESTFFVPGVRGLTVSCPTDPILPACSTAAEIQAAYDIWVAGFSVNNGDNPTSNIADIPALTAFDCGNAVNLSFTLSASDACTQDASCTATFTVLAEEDLLVSCPQNVNLPACSTQSEIEAAYALWAAGFTVQGGCNTTSNLDDLPALPAFDCGNEVSFSFTLNASDDCGDDSCSASFNVAAEDDLVVNCPSPVTLGSSLTEQEIITAYNLWVAGFTVEGGCNTTSNIDQIPSLPPYDCGSEIDLSFTLTASDDCGSTDCESTFFVPGVEGLTVSCPTDPILPACSTAAEIQAAYDIWVVGFSVNNGDNPTSNIADIPALTAFDCGNAVNLSFTLSASDACTQDASCTATFTVLAEEDLAVSCPQDVNLTACSTQSEIETAYALWAAGFTVQGGCNTTSNLDDLPALPEYVCINAISLDFTLSASDDCGQTSCSASFSVAAKEIVEVSCPTPIFANACDYANQDALTAAYETWLSQFIVTNAGCNAQGGFTVDPPEFVDFCAGAEITLTYIASDGCTGDECTSTFSVLGDLDAPVITTDAQSDNLGCNPVIVAPIFSVEDECNPNAVVLVEDSGIQGTECEMSRTWTATYENLCHISDPVIITYTWTDDTDKPIITSDSESGPLGCNPEFSAPSFFVDDECNPNAMVFVEMGEVLGGSCDKSQTWTATYSNGCHVSDPLSINFTWTEDTEIPVIIPNSETKDLGCNPTVVDPEFMVTDNCGVENAEISVQKLEEVIVGCNHEQTWIANYTDPCGNDAEEVVITYTWIEDNEAPEITFVNPMLSKIGNGGTLQIQCYGQDPEWSLPEASVNDVSVSDDCEGEVSIVASEEPIAEGECATDGFIKRYRCSWTATDACGNVSELFVYMEIVDNIPPVIEGVPGDVTVPCNEIPEVPNVIATDECLCADLEMTESTVADACLDGQVIVRTWIATDCCGNTAIETQTITLSDDVVPTLEVELPDGTIISADASLEFDCNAGGLPGDFSALSEANAIAMDICSGEASIEFSDEEVEIDQCVGGAIEMHTFTWTAIDDCENSTAITLTVYITDTVAPIIMNIEDRICASEDADPFIYAQDACSNAVLQHYDVEIEGGCGSEFLRIFEAYDVCGNYTRAEQYIIKKDFIAPDIELTHSDLIGLNSGDSIRIEWYETNDGRYTDFDVEDANYIDECGFELASSFEEELVVQLDCQEGNIKAIVSMIWTAEDLCGNVAEFIVYGIIEDTQAPNLVNFEPQVTVSCSKSIPEIEAEDNSGSVEVTIDETIEPGDCPSNYVVIRQIRAVDECNNAVEATQTVNVVDETGPQIFGIQAYVCEDLTIPDVTAKDECSDDILPVSMVQDTIMQEDCVNELIIRRIWSATDLCGNTTDVVQMIVFNDTIAPELVYSDAIQKFLGKTTSVYMSDANAISKVDAINWYNIVALDLCINMQIIPDYNMVSEIADDCEAQGYYEKRTFSWVFTDICGNESSEEFVVLIIDDVAPLLLNVPLGGFFGCHGIPELGNIDPPEFGELMDSMTGVITFNEVEDIEDDIITVSNIWTASDMCGNVTEAVQELSAILVSDLEVNITGGEDILCNSHGNLLTANVMGGTAPFTYEWTIDGQDCQIQGGQGSPTLEIYVGFSDVLVTVKVTDTNGCEFTTELQLICISKGQSGDRSIDFEEEVANDLLISNLAPNPTSDQITVSLFSDIEQNINYNLIDMMNQKVMSKTASITKGANNINVNVRDYAPGIYYIMIENGRSSDVKRFIKVK